MCEGEGYLRQDSRPKDRAPELETEWYQRGRHSEMGLGSRWRSKDRVVFRKEMRWHERR